VVKTILTIQPELFHKYRVMFPHGLLAWHLGFNFLRSSLLFIFAFLCAAADTCAGSCFQLLGFDVMLTQNGKENKDLTPWVVEVNRSPSLQCDAPLDIAVKVGLHRGLYILVAARLE